MDRGCEWPAQPGCGGKVRILSVVSQASVCGGRLPGGLGENGETGLELVLGDEEGLFLKPFGEEFVQGLEHDRFGRPAFAFGDVGKQLGVEVAQFDSDIGRHVRSSNQTFPLCIVCRRNAFWKAVGVRT